MPNLDTPALDPEIQAFHRLLPSLRREHGDVWAVVAGERLRGCFGTFRAAADFALSQLGDATFLIRHTNAPQPHIPYIAIES